MTVEEQVEKIIEAKADRIRKDTISAIDGAAVRAASAFEAELKKLKEQSRIALPVNLLDIISAGGDIRSKVVELEYSGNNQIATTFPGHSIRSMGIHVGKGKYRVTVIMEKLEES